MKETLDYFLYFSIWKKSEILIFQKKMLKESLVDFLQQLYIL